MKTIIFAVILIFVAATTSCEKSAVTQTKAPPGPDPVTVLEEQVATERQLREEAQAKVEEETTVRNRWQMATLGLAVVALIGFFGGTAIGSRGRYHANVPS